MSRRLNLHESADRNSCKYHPDTMKAGSAWNKKRQIPTDRFTLEFESMYDENITKGLTVNQISDQNRKLRTKIVILEKKLKTKDALLQDSLACTFVACPCSSDSKDPNF
jgi:hypothetical protein